MRPHRKKRPREFSFIRALAIILVGTALAGLLAYLAMNPVRRALSQRYVDRGDQYMDSRDFDLAVDEYATALRFDPTNRDAKDHAGLAKLGPVDPAGLRGFYASRGQADLTAKIDAATLNYADPKAALQAGADLYARHEYGLARYALEQAVKLDPKYPEAWQYLYLDYAELAKLDSAYGAKAAVAKDKRDALTTKYL